MGKENKLPSEDKAQTKKRAEKIFSVLTKTYPDSKTTLDHQNSFQLLIATILAAQCTDARVNIVTKQLFKKYRTPQDYLEVSIEELKKDIRSTGFYNNKAKSIRSVCSSILQKPGGSVPRTMEELLLLSGVGRKTANVILGNCFDQPAIICDTHMIRLSRRLGLSNNTDPVKLEFDLMEIIPKKKYGGWTKFSHCIVFHGRTVCKARRPECQACVISDYCPAAFKPDLW